MNLGVAGAVETVTEVRAVNIARALEQLAEAISKSLGSRVRLNAQWQDNVSHTPAQQIAAARQAKLVKTRQLISQDPVVVALVREFGGQLDVDSIQPDDPTAH